MQSDSEDQMFVNRCLEGDWAAFAFLVDKYKEVVHAYAYHRISDHQGAEDIVQEVFIKVYRKLAQLKWPHRFRSWLYTIASNECKMWLRKHSREREREMPLEDAPIEELDELAVRSHSDEDIKLTVESAMETLPDDRQLALSLFYMSNLSVKEIAHFMGVSPNSVKIKLHRVRKQLGERLEEMIGKHFSKEKLKAGFVFKMVDAIRDMPIPSLPKPRPIRWTPIPISIGLALLIGIIGFGVSSGKDASSDMPILKPAASFEVSLLPDPDRQTILDTEPENISDLAMANVGATVLLQSVAGTKSSGVVVRRLWDDAGDAGPVSPDGRYASYVNWNQGNLAIHDFESGESRDITDEGNWGEDMQFADASTWSTWSPDSKQIAYVWDSPRGSSLRIVGIDGAKPRVLCSSPKGSGGLFPRTWSRDGKHILTLHCKKTDETHDHDIVLVSVADGSIRVLKSLGPRHGYWMSLSPDGRYVVYDHPQGEDSPEHDVLLLAADGSQETMLVEHPADDFALFWASDGNRIVFASDRSGTKGVWVLEVADGKPKGSPRLISDDLNGMSPLGLTQDGSYYYGLPGRKDDIYFADLDPETGKVVTSPIKAVQDFEGLNRQPAFSPDGKRLVYVSMRRPWGMLSRSLIVRSLETGEERELQPEFPLAGLLGMPGSAPRWSPDGRSILVWAKVTDAAKETHDGIHQMHVDTGAVTPVVLRDISGSTPPVWSPDGNKIFFMQWQGDSNSIGVYDLEAKREWSLDFRSKLGKDYKKHNLAISPDGQQLAFVECSNGHSIHIAPASGGETREVLTKAAFSEGTGLVWTPDGRYLLFGKWSKWTAKEKVIELWRISVEGGKPQNLGLAIGKIEHLSIHPDGHRIAFTGPGQTPGAEVWVMENILSKSTASR